MADIIATNTKVREDRIDPDTGERVLIERDAFLVDDGKGNWVATGVVELSRQPAPPVVKTAEEQLTELKAAIAKAATFAALKTEVAKLPAPEAVIKG